MFTNPISSFFSVLVLRPNISANSVESAAGPLGDSTIIMGPLSATVGASPTFRLDFLPINH